MLPPKWLYCNLCCLVKRTASTDQVNAAFIEAAAGSLKGILTCESEPLVSVDFVGLTESACVDLGLTNVSGNLVKVAAWYDNEMGFSHRVLELADYIGSQL